MNDKTYNGWTNYETWNYALWLAQGYWEDQAKRILRHHSNDEDGRKEAINRLSGDLKNKAEEYAEQNMQSQSGWIADAVNAYLGEIDWYEIAEHFLADIEEEKEETE